MDNTIAIRVFEALSSAVRLDVFRLLIKHEPTGLVAGDIAQTLGIQPTNLSFHLKALSHAGLLRANQEGRFLRYHAQVDLAHDLVDYLTAECCHGNAAACDASNLAAARTSAMSASPPAGAIAKRRTAASAPATLGQPVATPGARARRAGPPARRGTRRD